MPCVFIQVDIFWSVESSVADCAISLMLERVQQCVNALVDCHDDNGKSSTVEVAVVDHCSVVYAWNRPSLLCSLAYLEMCHSGITSMGL